MDGDGLYDAYESDLCQPCWLSQPRGFVDMPSKAADELHDFLTAHLGFAVESWAISQQCWVFRFPALKIELTHDLGQPLTIAATSMKMHRKYVDALRVELRSILSRSLLEPSWSGTGFGVMLLQMTEEAEGWLQSWLASVQPTAANKAAGKHKGWDPNTVNLSAALFDNPYGINILNANDTAKHILGQSITDICKGFDEDGLRILHVEPVFRDDLVARFLQKKADIHKRLRQLSHQQLRRCISREMIEERRIVDTKEGLAEELAQPSVTFHGAPRHIISSIIRYGFLVPGQKIGDTGKTLGVECGSSYGVGIYSSPDPGLASCYARYSSANGNFGFASPQSIPGQRLLVCATLMGRTIKVEREEARRMEGILIPEADSHVSPSKLEYIVFDAAQILPCYVLHIDYGVQHANWSYERMLAQRVLAAKCRAAKRSHLDIWDMRHREIDTSPGAVQAKKQALKAAAAKWFPYGYGPAEGTRFVIEEIGEISDDEEDYGEFQELRNEQGKEIQERKVDAGGSWFDEYQTVRTTNKQIRVAKEDS